MKINWFSVFELFLTPNSAVIINLRALPHFSACLFNWIQEVLWKNSRNVESVICHVVWCCRPPTFKKFFLAPWLLPWIYPWDFPCISYSLLVPWVLPCWHPWVLPWHLDTLGVQCTLNILVPLIYQQFRSDFIIAALTPLLSPTLPRCLLFCPPLQLAICSNFSQSHQVSLTTVQN